MAFFQEQGSRQPFLRAPPVVLWLIAILIGAHALRVFVFAQQSDTLFVTYGFVPARYSSVFLATHAVDPGTWLDRALPFVTYMFLHGGFAHVAINSVWLLAFGPVVARRFGTLLFLIFFLVCGIGGAAAHLVSNWGSTAPVIGASAAISGLMAAGFRMLRAASEGRERALAPIFSRQILVWTALWAGVNVIAGVTGLGAGGGVQLVAWQAHLGGYATGLVLAGVFDVFAAGGPARSSAPQA